MKTMNAEVARSVDVDSSVGNIFSKSTLYTALWPAHAYVDAIMEAEYKGFQWLPFRGLPAAEQVNHGLISPYVKDAIRSLHQSYRSEKSFKEALQHPNPFLATLSYVLLPERTASLNDLEQLQKVVGRELPVVLYPPEGLESSGTDKRFAQKLFQPTPEITKLWGVTTISGLRQEAIKRGYTGFCTDLFHMRVGAENSFTLEPWQETLPQLLEFTKEIHIAAGRIDIPQDKVDTMSELQDLRDGTRTTELTSMLFEIGRLGWNGRIVTEIPATALRTLRTDRSSFYTPKNLIEDHRRIVGNVHDILS